MSKKFLLSFYKTVLCKFFQTRSKNRVIENRVMENRVKRGNTVGSFSLFIQDYRLVPTYILLFCYKKGEHFAPIAISEKGKKVEAIAVTSIIIHSGHNKTKT